MRLLRITVPVAVAALVLFPVPVTPVAGGELEPFDFTGVWELDRQASDDPGQKMSEAREKSGNSRGDGLGGGRGGRGGGGKGGGGMGRSGGGMGQGPERTSRPGQFLHAVGPLVIEHQEPVFSIQYVDDHIRTIYTDGRKEKVRDEFGTVTVRAKWKDGAVLEVTRSIQDGPKSVELFELSEEDGKPVLKVATAISSRGRGPSFSFVQLYRPI